jgi:hypothetical protein
VCDSQAGTAQFIQQGVQNLIICGPYQNQPPTGWFKKYKIENKTLLYGTVTYITALLYYMEQLHT